MKNVIELAKESGTSANDLVKVLLAYTQNLPSIGEVAFQAKALTAEQVLEVFILQSKEGMSFRSACEKLNFWSVAVQAAVVAQAQKGNTDLGMFLAANAILSVEQLAPYSSDTPTAAPMKEAAAQPVVTASNAADVELTNDERRQLCDLLADDAKDKFFAALETVKAGRETHQAFEAIHQIVHETKGILRFIALPVIEASVERAELITEALSSAQAVDSTVAVEVANAFRAYGDAMWNLKKDGATWPEGTISNLLNQIQTLVRHQKEAA